MIAVLVDTYWPKGSEGVGIYTRHRDDDDVLVQHTHTDIRPYMWVNTDEADINWESFYIEFPDAQVESDEIAKSIKGKEVMKISCVSPYHLVSMSKYFTETYEADVPIIDQWMIDTYPAKVPQWNVRKCWFDIEWNPVDGNDFTQCWAAIDSFTEDAVCFAWRENQTSYQCEDRDGYTLHIYRSEEALHEGVLQYIEEMDFDMLIAHAAMWADIPHMVRRFKNFRRLSPLGQVSNVREGFDGYRHTDQPIKGRWVFDTACRGSDGSGFERVWMDSGNGQFPSRKLGDIGEHLKLGKKYTVDLTNDWTDNFYRLTDYCVQDVRLMMNIDQYLRATDFFTSMVGFCGVSFTSTFEVGKFARGLVCRITNDKFATRHRDRRRERGDVQGATVMTPTPGRHEGVAVLDFKGLYPSIMLGDNLCWTTQRDNPSETTRTMANGTHWEQEEQGVLPVVIEYLFTERQKLKDSGDKILEKAVKRVMASLYGLVTESLGHGMADTVIGETILSQGRSALDSLRTQCEDMGYPVLFGHTDSCFVQCPLDELHDVSAKLTDIIQKETGNPKLIAEPEVWMPYWFCADVKNRYAGIISWPEEDAGKLKVSGFEMKHSSTPPFIRDLQKQVLIMLGGNDNENDITSFVKGEVVRLRNNDVAVENISTRTRLSKAIESSPDASHRSDKHYPKTSGGYAKSARYYNWYMNPDEPYAKGDSVLWTYVAGVPQGMPTTDVVAYRDPAELHGFKMNAEHIVDKQVRKKLRLIYDVMGWDLKRAIDLHQPKTYW